MAYSTTQQFSTPSQSHPAFFVTTDTPSFTSSSTSQSFCRPSSYNEPPRVCDLCENEFNALLDANAELSDYVLDLEAQLSWTQGSVLRATSGNLTACILHFPLAVFLCVATYVLQFQDAHTTLLCAVIGLVSGRGKEYCDGVVGLTVV
jgi:hypothetical protein